MRSFRHLFIICIVLCLLCAAGIAGAQSPATVKGMKLPETKITLTTDGDNPVKILYPQFTDNYDGPAANEKLHLFSTDENVVRVVNRAQDDDNPRASINMLSAKGKGTAKVFAYTDDWKYSVTLTVSVTGSSVENDQDYNTGWKNPASKALSKVKDPALKAFFTLLGKKDMAKTAKYYAGAEETYAYEDWEDQHITGAYKYQPIPMFKTIITLTWPKDFPENAKASVIESLQDKIENDEEGFGMRQFHYLHLIDAITVSGTAWQYKQLLEDKDFGSFIGTVIEDPISYTQGGEDMPEGQAEALSHFRYAETLFGEDGGLTGDGTVIAFLDTGIDSSHEQFEDKIIEDACFSSYADSQETWAVCSTDDDHDNWTENPDKSIANEDEFKNNRDFQHGTAVAAAAAGKDGIAKNAEIIAYNVFSNKSMWYLNTFTDEGGNYHSEYNSWRIAVSYASDQMRAMEHLLDRLDDDEDPMHEENIVALNMSFGGGKETKACTADIREPYFKAFLEKEIIPVAAAGSNGYDGAVAAPACSPSVFTVGALWDSADPEVAGFSNHSSLVNIMAPGTQILSANSSFDQEYNEDGTPVYADENGNGEPDWNELSWTWRRDYANKNGTSMAAPMVSGAIAQMREFFPIWEDMHQMSAAGIENLLTGMAAKTAARKNVKVPVLDFSALRDVTDFIFDPFAHQGVLGGNKFLQAEFKKIPFNTQYTIKVWKADKNTGYFNDQENPFLTKTGKNLLTYKITGLENGELYSVRAEVDILFGKESFHIEQNGRLGMPMVLPSAKEAAAEYTIDVIHPEDENRNEPQLKFNGTYNEETGDSYWVIWASNVDDHVDIADIYNNWTTHARWDSPITADFLKTKIMKFPNDPWRCENNPDDENACEPYQVYSMPIISVDEFPVRKPAGLSDWRFTYGRLWLGFDDPEPYITSRDIEIDLLRGDTRNDEPDRDENDNFIVTEHLKPVHADTKKYPNDVVITGLPDNTWLQVRITATGTYNKKPYTSREWILGDWGEGSSNTYHRSWTPEYDPYRAGEPSFDASIAGVDVTAGDKTAAVTYRKDLTVDGMRFELKPVDPNHTRTVQEVTMAKNPTSYTFTGLTNGTVYKLRMQQTLKVGKNTLFSSFFPGKWHEEEWGPDWDHDPRPEDTAWDGITFIPLAAPQVTYRSHPYAYETRRELVVKGDKSADGFVIIEIGYDPEENKTVAFAETYPWTSWNEGYENWDFEDGQKFWMNNEDPENPGYNSRILAGDNPNLNHVVMLYKEWNGHTYYGPAAYLSPVNLLPDTEEYPDYITTGPKSVEAIDMLSIPEIANAAQIDGKVFAEFTESGIEAKAIAEAKEVRLMDIFAVDAEDAEMTEEEADFEVKEAEETVEDEFEQYPEIIIEDFTDNELPAEESSDTEADTPETEEDEYESYPEIQYPEFEEPEPEPEPEEEAEPAEEEAEPVEVEEKPAEVEEKSVPAPAVPEKKEQKEGFSLFHF